MLFDRYKNSMKNDKHSTEKKIKSRAKPGQDGETVTKRIKLTDCNV